MTWLFALQLLRKGREARNLGTLMTIGAFISGCEGLSLTAREIAFFERHNPWGLILFKRNIDSPEQITALTKHFRQITGRPDAPVLIDQEGGRVQRMGPPLWRKYPAANKYSILYDSDPLRALKLARLITRLMAKDLLDVGINVDCLPVLDVPQPGSHQIIGDRAYGVTPERVSVLARAAVTGLMEGGVSGIINTASQLIFLHTHQFPQALVCYIIDVISSQP